MRGFGFSCTPMIHLRPQSHNSVIYTSPFYWYLLMPGNLYPFFALFWWEVSHSERFLLKGLYNENIEKKGRIRNTRNIDLLINFALSLTDQNSNTAHYLGIRLWTRSRRNRSQWPPQQGSVPSEQPRSQFRCTASWRTKQLGSNRVGIVVLLCLNHFDHFSDSISHAEE